MTEKTDELSVEAILEELSDIADELENGDLPLDKALSLFERCSAQRAGNETP